MAALIAVINEFQDHIIRRPRVYKDRASIMDEYDDLEVISRYRLNKDLIWDVTNTVRADIERPTQRSNSLKPITQVLCTLRYLSKGGFLSEIGDLHGVSKASVSRCITAVTKSIADRMGHLLEFPIDDLQKTKEEFFDIGGMPNVVGCLDGTLVPILRPVEDEAAFICRKGFHAINVQGICDARLRFTNIVAKWPGSAHDSFIWNNCNLSTVFERGQINGWLLGDSGYPLRPWLLTPVLRPGGNAQEKFNRSHIKTRNAIERAFGLLKSRFTCLHKSTGCLMFCPEKCCDIIKSCCILHNLCINNRLPFICEDDIEPIEQNAEFLYNGPLNDGNTTRQNLIINRFS